MKAARNRNDALATSQSRHRSSNWLPMVDPASDPGDLLGPLGQSSRRPRKSRAMVAAGVVHDRVGWSERTEIRQAGAALR